MNRASLIHIDDEPELLGLVKELCSRWPEVAHVGAATSAIAGVQLYLKHIPDIILLDLRLPDVNGFNIINIIASQAKICKVVLLTACCDEATLYLTSNSAIWGMVWKGASIRDELRKTLFEVSCGRKYLSIAVSQAVRDWRSQSTSFIKILSEREIALLPLFGLGETDNQISERIGLHPTSVHSHRENIMKKLNLHRTTELVRWIEIKGFLRPTSR